MADVMDAGVMRRAAGVIEGNFAAALGQLTSGSPESRLVVDSREVLAAGARLVGSEFGEPEIDTYIALSACYAEQGSRDSGDIETTKGALARTIYGSSVGGRNRALVHKALVNLFRMELQFSGVDADTGEYESAFVALERLLVRLEFSKQIGYRTTAPHRYDPALVGAERDGTVRATFARWHVRQIQRGYWVSVDWEKLRSLNGAAKLLWLMLSSPRVPFTECRGADHLEQLQLAVTMENYRALGINSAERRRCKFRLLQYGRRLLEVDDSYLSFEVANDPHQRDAHQLIVVRRRPDDVQLALESFAGA